MKTTDSAPQTPSVQKPEHPKECEICGETRHAYFSKLNGKVLCREHWQKALLLSIGKTALVILLLIGLIMAV